jgi:hypothetical protein
MRKPGLIVKLSDGLLVIVYNEQPLRVPKGKIILHLVDENHNLILREDKTPKILIKSEMDYCNEMQASKLIGYVD